MIELAAHEMAAMLFLVTIGLANVAAIREGKAWVFGIKFARVATIAVAASVFLVRGGHLLRATLALTLADCLDRLVFSGSSEIVEPFSRRSRRGGGTRRTATDVGERDHRTIL